MENTKEQEGADNMKLNVLVHAAFKNLEETDRIEIYKCLVKENYTKILDHGITTLWEATSSNYSVDELTRIVKADFKKCAASRGKSVTIYFLISTNNIQNT